MGFEKDIGSVVQVQEANSGGRGSYREGRNNAGGLERHDVL